VAIKKYTLSLLVLLLSLGLLCCITLGQENKTKSSDTKIPEGMVEIPSGTYKLFFRKKEEKPVAVKAFYLDIYAVTNLEFLKFVTENPAWQKTKVSKIFADQNYLSHWEGDLSIGVNFENIKNSPVTNISWFAANAYAKWKNKRLPTILEWEYVASADIVESDQKEKKELTKVILDWYAKPNPKIMPSVGSTFKNTFGVYDTHGLIWEWVHDFNSFVSGSDSRSNSEVDRDLFCGGAGAIASANKEDYAAYMRYGFRGSLKGNYTVANLGFRCGADILDKTGGANNDK
jgi:formylglycine-generating enzyme required for sulfatase activity